MIESTFWQAEELTGLDQGLWGVVRNNDDFNEVYNLSLSLILYSYTSINPLSYTSLYFDGKNKTYILSGLPMKFFGAIEHD